MLRKALGIIRRYPSAVIVPGAVLGALAEAPAYLIADHLPAQHLTYLGPALAYYLYLAYAEGLTTDYESGRDLIASRGSGLARILEAASFVPRVLVAALLTVSLASAATVLLVAPGVWLYTRWSMLHP